jgi:hypothetical protein
MPAGIYKAVLWNNGGQTTATSPATAHSLKVITYSYESA